MVGLVIFTLLTCQPLPAPLAAPRPSTIEAPLLLWEEGPPVIWTREGDNATQTRFTAALMAQLMPPSVAVGESLFLSLDASARVTLVSADFEFYRLSGPQSVRFTRLGSARVAMTRVAATEGASPSQEELAIVTGPRHWVANALNFNPLNTTLMSETTDTERAFDILWPNSRALRPSPEHNALRVAWRDKSADPDTRYGIEVEELNSHGEVLRVQERWTGIASSSLTLRVPWIPGRRYRLTVTAGARRVSTETRILGEEAASGLDELLLEVRALSPRLGVAAAALETLILDNAELDSEARIRWWHLAMAALADGNQARAEELFGRSGRLWP